MPPSIRSSLAWVAAIAFAVLLVHGAGIVVNFESPDWTHWQRSQAHSSLISLIQLFTVRQDDGFYRPLGFLSLWFDFRLFGFNWNAYHLQNILFQIFNAVLVALLGMDLRLPSRAAWMAGLLYAIAPFTFEAVLWPAARFDILANMFVLLALIFCIRILRTNLRASTLCYAGTFYALGLMSKESAYCVPLILVVVWLTRDCWAIRQQSRRTTVALVSLLTAVTAGMLVVRAAVVRGAGGYESASGVSEHGRFSEKTVESIFTRVFGITPFTANLSTGITPWLAIGLPLLIVSFAAILIHKRRVKPCNLTFLALAAVSALPTLNIITWVGVDAQQSRYLYLPGVWLSLLFGCLLTDMPKWIYGLLLTGSALITESDLQIYRDMLNRTRTIAQQVSQASMQAHAKTVVVSNFPNEPNGIFFFRDEVKRQILKLAPGVTMTDVAPVDASQAVYYRWDSSSRMLVREQNRELRK